MIISERSRAAAQINLVRKAEWNKDYSVTRRGTEYLRDLEGLAYFFEYVRSLDSNVILDIGAGSTRGISDVAKKDWAHGLTFKATGLVKHPKLNDYLGEENFTQTSAEVLRGIPDNSVAGIISVFSITYSVAPDLVVDSIDRVLVPGGVIKATLRPTIIEDENVAARHNEIVFNKLNARTGSEFKRTFEKKGYDTGIQNLVGHDVLVAIKPGGNPDTTAISILDKDLNSLRRF